MSYTNSSLVKYTCYSPNHSGQRTHSIDRITPHCVVGQVTIERLGDIFKPSSRQASSNYGIGSDGRVGLFVDEANRSWCSSSNANDQRAVTIECASDTSEPYAFKDVVYASLIDLCTDICRRNGKTKLLWLKDKDTSLNYTPKSNEMILTVHRWFANKSCPGNWLMARMGDLANQVTARLNGEAQVDTGKIYRVQIGAFKEKKNADNLLARVKKSFPDAFIKCIGGYYKVQIGAYRMLDNATKMLEKAERAGFTDAFIKADDEIVTKKKSIDEIAREVINGKWGNGADRKTRLTQAGYNYSEVQDKVNELLR